MPRRPEVNLARAVARLDWLAITFWILLHLQLFGAFVMAFLAGPGTVWLAWYTGGISRVRWVLSFYWLMFCGCMHGLAVAVLLAGLVLPPISLAWWAWRVYHDFPPF